MYHEAKHSMESYGVVIKDLSFDIKKMMAQKDKAVRGLTAGVEGLLKKNKVGLNAPALCTVLSFSRLLAILHSLLSCLLSFCSRWVHALKH